MASRAEPFPFEHGVTDLVATYRAAQREISAQVIAAVKAGNLERAQARRLQLARLLALLDQIGAQTEPIARRLVAEAHAQGAAATVTQLGASVAPEIPGAFAGISREAVAALQDAMVGRLRDSRLTVGRQAQDVYATAGRRAALRAILGAEGSPQAAARQLAQDLQRDKDIARLVKDSRGAVGFVDKAGKRWSMDTYAEMVVRTTTRQAVVRGQVDRMASHGVNLARVSTHSSSCPICIPLEGKLISLDGTVSEYQGEPVADSSSLPPFHPNCFVPDTKVSGVHDGVLSRAYEGEVVRIDVASGHHFTCTPNHPVLTQRGWVAAGDLDQSDNLLRCRDMKAAMARVGVDPHDYMEPTPIGEVAEALPVILREMPVAAEDFHGDGGGSEVYVVHAHGKLGHGLEAEVTEHGCEGDLVTALVLAGLGLHADGASLQVGDGAFHAADGGVCPLHARHAAAHLHTGAMQAVLDRAPGASELRGDGFGAQSFGVQADAVLGRRHVIADGMTDAAAAGAQGDASIDESGAHPVALDPAGARDLHVRLAGLIAPDGVRSVNRSWFRGHVANLTTPSGWYFAEGLIVHNCRHTIYPVVAAVDATRERMAANAAG